MSFLTYICTNEQVVVERALQGTLEESDERDLLDLSTRMGSHCLPPKDNLVSAIQTMSYKAMLQEFKCIFIIHVALWKFPCLGEVLGLICLCKRMNNTVQGMLSYNF